MLGLCHRTFFVAERIKQGEWILEGGHDLSGKTVGIIGCGNVGKEVVRLLKLFGCVIMVYDIQDRSEFCCDQGITQSSFQSLAEKSDIITLHVPLTDLTQDMIDEAILRKMQRASYLINTSRGHVVNPSALNKALVSGKISGAALDVFCSEPPNDIEFLQLPNLMITPHIIGNSIEAVEAMGQAAIDNLVAFLKK
jgi:phosphoglycerate dehydrogenase-like enzyme